MQNTKADIQRLSQALQSCQKMFIALGDENRQRLLLLMLNGPCSGRRVADIAVEMHLSRPAVSHHMQILKDAGLVRSRKEGTFVYYYLEPQERELEKMTALLSDIRRIRQQAPDRSEDAQWGKERET